MEIHDRVLTVVVPIFNEIGSLEPLHRALVSALSTLRRRYEIIFIDDGSTDGSAAALEDIAARDPRIRILHFRRNYGKSAALDAGFRNASGGIVITLDGDLQNDPAEIPRFLDKIEKGADVVCGWRRPRQGSANRIISSVIFNAVMQRVSNAPIHDFNCGFKAFRAECLTDLRLYGGLHRFLPVLLSWKGFTIDEAEVTDRQRWSGKSKYSAWRIPTAALGLLVVLLIGKFRSRPLYFFGFFALPVGLVGIAALSCALLLWLVQVEPSWLPLMLYTALFLVISPAVLLGMGLFGEMVKSMLPFASPDYLTKNPTEADEAEIIQSTDVKGRRSL